MFERRGSVPAHVVNARDRVPGIEGRYHRPGGVLDMNEVVQLLYTRADLEASSTESGADDFLEEAVVPGPGS